MSGDKRLDADGADASLSLLAEQLEVQAPSSLVRANLVATLRGPERFTPHAGEVARMFGVAPADALEALRQIPDLARWQPGMWPGSRLLMTPALSRASAVISRLPSGLRIPKHRHGRRELTYILDGELIEDDRVRYGSGVLVDRAPGSAHEVAVPAHTHCLVVFALAPE